MKRNKKIVENFARNSLLIIFWEAADHAHRTAVPQHFCCGTNWLKVRKANHTFVCEADTLNILCDYQFVFSVFEELCVSHHA